MAEPVVALAGTVGRLLFAATKWIGKREFTDIGVHFARACALALDAAMTGVTDSDQRGSDDLDDMSFEVLQTVLLASFESADLLGDVLLRPLSGRPLADAALIELIFEGYIDRGGDPETAPLDVRQLIVLFVQGLPTAVRIVASEPGNPLFAYSVHALLLDRSSAEEPAPTHTLDSLDSLDADVSEVLSEEAFRAFEVWLETGEATPHDRESFREALRLVAARRLQNSSAVPHFEIESGRHRGITHESRTIRSVQAQDVRFEGIVSFDRSTFLSPTAFINCRFESLASFSGVRFAAPVSFRGSVFEETPDFAGATFDSIASFQDCVFENGAAFSRDVGRDADPAVFNGLVVATGAAFGARSDFSGSEFRGFLEGERILGLSSVSMRHTNFAQGGTLARAEFIGALELRGATVGQGQLILTGLRTHHIDWPDGNVRHDWFLDADTVREHGRWKLSPPTPLHGTDHAPAARSASAREGRPESH